MLALLLVLAKPRLAGGGPVLATEIPAGKYPVAAVQFIRAHPAALPGQMFNDMTWGGYLMLALPERKIFMHANLDDYGRGLVEQYNQVDDLGPHWQAVLQKYGVGWTILPARHPLNRLLACQPAWKIAYTDEVTAVYARLP